MSDLLSSYIFLFNRKYVFKTWGILRATKSLIELFLVDNSFILQILIKVHTGLIYALLLCGINRAQNSCFVTSGQWKYSRFRKQSALFSLTISFSNSKRNFLMIQVNFPTGKIGSLIEKFNFMEKHNLSRHLKIF